MQEVKHDFQVANQEISFGNVYMILNSRQNCFTIFDRNSCLTFKRSSMQYSEPVVIQTTGSPSSKYEHRRASALLRNIQNIRICLGKKPIVSVKVYLYRKKTVYIKTHRTAINQPVDHTGET